LEGEFVRVPGKGSGAGDKHENETLKNCTYSRQKEIGKEGPGRTNESAQFLCMSFSLVFISAV
jgi:hypothetical protein